jgi:CHAD domain-containing protein
MDTPRWPDEPVCHGQSVSEAFATILTHNFGRLGAWEEAARDWNDIEGVHQVRVAFRRMRSACSTFRPAVPKRATRRWRRRMRDLAGVLGPARDLDVLVSEVLIPHGSEFQLPGLAPFSAAVDGSRQQAYREVRRMLDGKRYAHFKRDFPSWCAARAWENADAADSPSLQAPIETFAAALLTAQYTAVQQIGAAAQPDNAVAMHRLRIECKKMRYLAEFFRSLFMGMEAFIAHLKGLQDLLGVMHDVAVAADLVDSIVGRKPDRELQRYAGALVGWRSHEHLLLRGNLTDRWREFAAGAVPWDEQASPAPYPDY